jgi:hypothetical protein
MRQSAGLGWQRTAAAGSQCIGFRTFQLLGAAGNKLASNAECRSYGERDAERSAHRLGRSCGNAGWHRR